MRKTAVLVFLLTVAAVLATPSPGNAYRRRHFSPNPFFYGGLWPFRPYWGWGYPDVVIIDPAPQVIIREQPAPPPVYIEKTQPAEQAGQYWYFCAESKGYYPYVKECPGGWLKVVPQTTPPPK